MSSTFWLINKRNEFTGCDYRTTELDVTENVGVNSGNLNRDWVNQNIISLNANTHSRGVQGNPGCGIPEFFRGDKAPIGEPAYASYHVYGVYWKSATELFFFLDGQQVFQVVPPADFDLDMYLRMVVETYDWNPVNATISNGQRRDKMDESEANRTTYYDWTRSWKLVDDTGNNDNPPTDTATIDCNSLPSTIPTSTSIPVSVNYTADQNRDVVIELWNATTNQWLKQGTTTVNAGSGTANITIDFDTAPAAGTNYSLKASIRPVGADWTQNINACNKPNITLTADSNNDGGGGSDCILPWTSPNQSINKETVNWSSDNIDISCATSVNITMDVEGLTAAVMEAADYLNIYYSVDGGNQIAISEDTDGFARKTISANNVSGSTLKLFISGKTSWQDETYNIMDILVKSNGDVNNDTATPDVDCTTLPSSVITSTSLAVSVDYTADQDRDVVIELWNATTNQWLKEGRTTVNAGSGTANISIDFDTAPAAGSDYSLKASIRPVGTDWTANLDACNKPNVTLTTDTTDGGNDNNAGTPDVDCVTLPSSVATSTSIPVSVDYTADQDRDVVIELWNATTNQWLKEGRTTVNAGSGTANITIDFATAPAAGSNYLLKASIRPVGSNWTESFDACNKPNITLTTDGGNGNDNTGGDCAALEENGVVAIEAEHFSSLELTGVRNWYLSNATSSNPTPDPDPNHAGNSSGNAYLEILPDTRVTHGDPLITNENFTNVAGQMTIVNYKVKFNTTGRYYVWVRAYSTGSEDNGVHVGLDGQWPDSGKRMQWCQGKNQWTWESKQRTEANHCGVAQQIYLDITSTGIHTVSFSMREDGFEMDKIVLSKAYTKPNGAGPAEVLVDCNSDGGNDNPTCSSNGDSTNGRQFFDKDCDFLLANFDLRPDEDDVHAAAALASMLIHPDLEGIDYHAVAGAYGIQGNTYITAATPGLYNTLFGPKDVKWSDAHNERNASLNRVKNKIVAVINAGNQVFVQEAGQSDFTHDVLLVQHSDWNEDKTTQSKLNWVKNNTDYERIADGNVGGNGTPQYKNNGSSWLNTAKSNSNPNAEARNFWTQADAVCDNFQAGWENPTISGGGVDYSDCSEIWWIFNIGNDANTITKFWDRYVTNNTARSQEPDVRPSGNEVSMYPNPVNTDQLNINFSKIKKRYTDVKVTLYNFEGQILQEEKLDFDTNMTFRINSRIQNSIYFIRVLLIGFFL